MRLDAPWFIFIPKLAGNFKKRERTLKCPGNSFIAHLLTSIPPSGKSRKGAEMSY